MIPNWDWQTDDRAGYKKSNILSPHQTKEEILLKKALRCLTAGQSYGGAASWNCTQRPNTQFHVSCLVLRKKKIKQIDTFKIVCHEMHVTKLELRPPGDFEYVHFKPTLSCFSSDSASCSTITCCHDARAWGGDPVPRAESTQRSEANRPIVIL